VFAIYVGHCGGTADLIEVMQNLIRAADCTDVIEILGTGLAKYRIADTFDSGFEFESTVLRNML